MAFRDLTEPVALDPSGVGYQQAFVAEEAISRGQFVKPGGSNADEVEPSATDGEFVYGIADNDASAGDTVLVHMAGIRVRATSGTGSISASDPVASHGNTGEEGEVATATTSDYVIGRALQADVGTNDDVIVLLMPQQGPGAAAPK